jgi:integrase
VSKQRAQFVGEEKKPRGLFLKNGNWYWRINSPGLGDKIGDTGLKAIAQNVVAAQFQREEALRDLKNGLAGGTHKSNMPFVEAIPVFLEWYRGEHRGHPNTGKRASGSMASLGTFFGHTLLRNISAGQLDNFKTWRRNEHGVQEVTIRHDLHNLSQLLQYGIRQGWCEANPVEKVSIPSDIDAVRINYISPADEEAYFAAALKRSQALYDVGRIMICQGPRPEEVMKMRKSDLRNGTHMHVFGKSAASNRWLTMTEEVAGILLPRLELNSEWLFPSDSPLNRGGHIITLQRAHDAVIGETGLNFNIYDFRHTFATRSAIGPPPMPAPVLAAILGHSNMACLGKYIHPHQQHMDEAMRQTVPISVTNPVPSRHSFRHKTVTSKRPDQTESDRTAPSETATAKGE